MKMVRWNGPLPPVGVRRELERAGWSIGAAGEVVVQQRASVPVSPGDARPWLWVCARAITAEEARVAAARGAYDSLSLRDGSARLVERLGELAVSAPAVKPPAGFVAQSAAARRLWSQLQQAASTSMPVLLTGETGTGKELAARLIHQLSMREKKQFVPINCAAIPNELMESQLFGYVKGAFSGAVRDYDGQLVAAEGGTVFLDEIDDTPLPLQVKLLRVLEDRVVSRLGESVWRKVDFRILAATNRDLRPMIAAGAFGADVYERLSTVAIELPPLRERLEDLPQLVELLLQRFYTVETAPRVGRVSRVSSEVLAAMRAYAWPGNVRELRNVVFGALVSKRSGEELLLSDLPARLYRAESAVSIGAVNVEEVKRRVAAHSFNLRAEREQLEKTAIVAALAQCDGNANEAAKLLGEVGRGRSKKPGDTVRTMMRRLGIGRLKTGGRL